MNEIKDRKILIVGVGAVGGYYGAMLVKAGFDVTFLVRGKNYEALEKNGLTLIDNEKKTILPVKAIHELPLHKLPPEKTFDYIFICTKGRDTKSAVQNIKHAVGKNSKVISFQNGVENIEIIGNIIGNEKVIGGNLYLNSWLIEPGVVEILGDYYIKIGEINKEVESIHELTLQKIFELSGINCQISPDIIADMWNKLVWNASFNPVSVLTGKTVDKMLEDKNSYELIKNIMTEVKDVAIAQGINIRPDTVEFNLNRSKGIINPNAHLSQDFNGFKTSMLQDFENGKTLELEELVGVVIRKAKEKNISVPIIEKTYYQVKEKAASYTYKT